MQSMFTEILSLVVDKLRDHKLARAIIGISVALVFLTGSFFAITQGYWIDTVDIIIERFSPFLLTISGLTLFIVLASYTKYNFRTKSVDEELDSLRHEHRGCEDLPRAAASPRSPSPHAIELLEIQRVQSRN